MIARLSGKIIEKETGLVIIDVGGVGYEAAIPLSTFYELGDPGDDVSLRVYTHAREDTLQLFGFSSPAERELFVKLIAVSGIGPKVAISVLSGMNAEEIVGAIRTNDVGRLTSIPGIGRKTAERLIIELRDKVAAIAGAASAAAAGLDSAPAADVANEIHEDALSALVNLGYHRNAAEKAVTRAMNEGAENSVQKVLRRSLQLLAKG